MTERSRYAPIRIEVTVTDGSREVTRYSFWLDNDKARRAFAERCQEAWLAGQAITTKMIHQPDENEKKYAQRR